jgi:hypothetical protein
MMRSSIKNSNFEVTISQNPMEALRNNRSVVQSSHKGLIKSTGITGHGEGLLCQGLSLDKAQALFNAGILSGHQFNVGNLSNYHLKAGNLSESHSTNCRILMHFWLLHRLTMTCHCYHQTNCLAYQSVTTCHWYHQTNCLASQRVTTCHCY